MEIIWNCFLKPRDRKTRHTLRQITSILTEQGVRWREIAYFRRDFFVTTDEKQMASRDRLLRELKRHGIPDVAIRTRIIEADPSREQSLPFEQIDIGNYSGRIGKTERVTDIALDLTVDQLEGLKCFSFTLKGVTWPDGKGGGKWDEIAIHLGAYESMALKLPIMPRIEERYRLPRQLADALDMKFYIATTSNARLTEAERAIPVADFDLGEMAKQTLILDDPGAEEICVATNLRTSLKRSGMAENYPVVNVTPTRAVLVRFLPRGYRLRVSIDRDKTSTMGMGNRTLGAAATCFIELDGANFSHRIHHFAMIRDQKALDRAVRMVLDEAEAIATRLGDRMLSDLPTPDWMWPEREGDTK